MADDPTGFGGEGADEVTSASHRFLRAALDALLSHVAIVDERGTIVEVNEAWRRFADANGYAGGGCGLGENYLEACEAGEGRCREGRMAAEGIRAVLAGRLPVFTMEYPCHGPDERRWFALRATRFAAPGPAHALVEHETITARRVAEERLRESEADLADFFENAAVGLHWVGLDGTILRANRAELDLLGYAREEFVGRHIAEFHVDRAAIDDILSRLDAGETLVGYEARMRCKDGTIKHVLIDSNTRRKDGRFAHTRCFTRDITDRRRGEAVMAGELKALEMVARGATLGEVLETLTRTVEEIAGGGLLSSILLLDPDGVHLRHGAAPSLPPAYNEAIDGVAAGPSVGSCGTAAFRKERVIVSDIATDPLWADFRDLALGHGLRACWSTPILSSDDRVLGTFALYYAEPRHPSPQELRLVDLVTRTASIAIERKRIEEALREADRRKDEFLATLAHELRNPLAPIRNSLEILALRGDDPEAVAQAREVVDRQVRQMVRLVDDLLDVSRITRGKLALRKEPTDLAEVVASAVETSRPLVESRRHELEVRLRDEPLFLEGDGARLAQVLSNLLNNAAKYTEVGGRIWLDAGREGGDVVVRVRDTGVGITPDMMPRIFDLFAQVESTLDRAQGGLGIGLTLVRRLVEMHGGSVEASSEGPGKGSEFVVRLPAFPEPAAWATPSDAVAAPEPSPPRRVMIVDDNADSAESLALLLGFWGHDVMVAHDGLTAIERAQAFRPELVFLDIGLPKLDGYGVVRALRDAPGLEETLWVALTGYGEEEARRRSREAGFHRHMVKPVDVDELESLLVSFPG